MNNPSASHPPLSGVPGSSSPKTSTPSAPGSESRPAPVYGSELSRHQDASAPSTADATKDVAGNIMSDMAGVARNAATSTAKAVAAQASQLAANVTDELASTADSQKTKGAEAIKGIATALENAAGEFSEPAPMVADYMKSAATQIEGLSKNIRDRSVQELVNSAQDLARSQPALFFAGAVAAGFAVSRLLKSSAPPKPAHIADRPAGMGERAMQMQASGVSSGTSQPMNQQSGYRAPGAPGRPSSQLGGSGSDRS